jgi:hypothetical protein
MKLSSRADSDSEAPRWLYRFIPSVIDLLFIVLLLGLSCGALGRLLLRDGDTGWHIRNGQQILQTHAIPRVDSFSATMSGHTWYAWEWLYDLLIAAIHQVFGLNGVVFYTAAIIAVTFVLTFHLAMRRGGSLPLTLLLLTLSLAASAVHFLARPHVVSWLFAVIWFELLDSSTNAPNPEKNRRLFWLPVLMLVWVNVHGGFLLGFILLAIYIVGGVIQYFAHKAQHDELEKWLKRAGIVTALSLLASFINPYGYRLHTHVYQYLSDRFLMDRISEFRTPDFHGAAQQCFAILLLITIVAMASARRKPQPSHLLVILFAAYSGLYATRSLPVSSLLLTLLVAPLLSQTIADAGENARMASWLHATLSRVQSFSLRMQSMELRLQSHYWLMLVFVLGLWACMHRGRIGSEQFINAYFDDKRFPVRAAQVIEDRGIREPLFCPDLWGGYLIYRLYPQTKVLVDDRHDLYGDEFFRDYLRIIFVQPDWSKLLDEKHVNWILVEQNSSLATILKQTQPWSVIYQDTTAVLFERR